MDFQRNLKLVPKSIINHAANLNFIYHQRTEKRAKENLIVLHGLFGSHTNFMQIAKQEQISSKANSYLLDCRNHGLSEHRDTGSLPELALDLAVFIQNQGFKDFFLMGHSIGGRTIMTLLQNYPQILEMIKGIIIVDILPINYYITRNDRALENMMKIKKLAQLDLKQYQTKQEVKSIVSEIMVRKKLIDFLMLQIYKDNVDNCFKWKFNIKGMDNSYIPMINYEIHKTNYLGPAMFMYGENSKYVNKTNYHALKNVFPALDFDKDVHLFEGCGHWLHVENQKKFVELSAQFIEKNGDNNQ